MQYPGDGGGARRRVEADGVAGAAAARGIVRQHAGEALVGRRLAPEPRPRRRELGDEGDPVGERPVHDGAELGRGVLRTRGFERDGAGENPPVDLGHGDMHGEIGGTETAVARRAKRLAETPASTTCSTGASTESRTVPSLSSRRAEKAVALSTTSKACSAIRARKGAIAASSLRLVT